MFRFNTIKAFTSAFGGYEYRVTSDGDVVHYQERAPGARSFITKAREEKVAFDAFAAECGLFDPYHGDDPAIVARRIDYLND